jgi:Ca2+-binding RTX toxin-like protein
MNFEIDVSNGALGDGTDQVNGNNGDDTVNGGNGNDTLTGGGDVDALDGQAGNDTGDCGGQFGDAASAATEVTTNC